MIKRRTVLSFILLFAAPFLLVHFQNCAPQGALNAGGDTQAHIIEDLNRYQIQFLSANAELQDDVAQAGVPGFCMTSHDGAKLNWLIWDGNNASAPLESGVSRCNSGEFQIDVELSQVICGVSHTLVVEGDWGASTVTHVTRRCQPLASQPIAPPHNSPYGTTCVMEYSPATAAENPCAMICYRSANVVLNQALEISQCAALAASVAGR